MALNALRGEPIYSLPDLIAALYDIVEGQYKELERCLSGRGTFTLSTPYRHHKVQEDVRIVLIVLAHYL
jgi:hypothetical protein